MWIRTLDYIFAAAGLAGHVVVLALLWRRRLLRQVPIFAFLIAFYLVRSLLLLLPHFSRDWPRIYWLLIYLDPGLQLLLILSLVFVIWRVVGARTLIALPFLLLVALLMAWYVGYARFTPQNLALKLSVFVSALWVLVTAFLLLALRGRELASKKLTLGIALGFAAYSAANLVTEVVHTHFHLRPQPILFTQLSFFRAFVYLACVAWWCILFFHDRSRPTARLNADLTHLS